MGSCDWAFDTYICFYGGCRNGDCSSENFVSNLYTALVNIGIHTVTDHSKLCTETLVPAYVVKDIETSRTIILVISHNYASSIWFLRRLVKILELKDNHSTGPQTIFPVFYDLESYDVGELEENIAKACDSIEQLRWRKALTRLNAMTGWQIDKSNERIVLRNFVHHLREALEKHKTQIPSYPQNVESTSTGITQKRNWIFLLGNLVLEIISATFNQYSSPSKPGYALTGLIVAFIAVIFCSVEFFYIVQKEKAKLGRKGYLCWFLTPTGKLFGSFADIFGLILAILQCIFSAIDYSYMCRHTTNPVKLSIFSIAFTFCVAFSKLIKDCDLSATLSQQKKQI